MIFSFPTQINFDPVWSPPFFLDIFPKKDLLFLWKILNQLTASLLIILAKYVNILSNTQIFLKQRRREDFVNIVHKRNI